MLEQSEHEYLTRKEAAALAKKSVKWFEALAAKGEGPPIIKFKRAVLYRKAEVTAWIERHAQPMRGGHC